MNSTSHDKEIWKPGNMLYPLPVVMVSCQKEGGKPNIITVAWAGTICTNPAMVSISVRKERFSHSIIRESGEFVINLTTRELAFATDYCGVKSGRDVDKFQEMKLTAQKAQVVSCPLIAESPVNIECRVTDIRELGSHDMFIAEVVSVSASPQYMDEQGRFDFRKTDPICYSHGEYYTLGDKIGKFGYSVKKKRKAVSKKKTKSYHLS